MTALRGWGSHWGRWKSTWALQGGEEEESRRELCSSWGRSGLVRPICPVLFILVWWILFLTLVLPALPFLKQSRKARLKTGKRISQTHTAGNCHLGASKFPSWDCTTGQHDYRIQTLFSTRKTPPCQAGTASLWFEKVEVTDSASVRKVPPASNLWPCLRTNSTHFSFSDRSCNFLELF